MLEEYSLSIFWGHGFDIFPLKYNLLIKGQTLLLDPATYVRTVWYIVLLLYSCFVTDHYYCICMCRYIL